jgi:hypothetical protein
MGRRRPQRRSGTRNSCKGGLPPSRCVAMALRLFWLFVLASLPLVYCLGPASPALSQTAKETGGSAKKRQSAAAPVPEVRYGVEGLPGPVMEMREAIFGAIKSGRIDDLRFAYELNELKPDLGADPGGDPVAYWKKISGDGAGYEILAVLAGILEAGYVELPLGRDLENNKVYVWPYFAEIPVGRLTPAQEVELLRLVSPEAAKQMQASGKYTFWRAVIGADGVWHSFRKGP